MTVYTGHGTELFPGLLGFSCYPGGRFIFVTIYKPSGWSKAVANTTSLLHSRKIEGNYFSLVCALPTERKITLWWNKRNLGVHLDPLGNEAFFSSSF